MNMSSKLPNRDECTYTKCYCEENVWKLCKYIEDSGKIELLSNSYAIFISNHDRTIPLWKQKASKRSDTMVMWDYHVILFVENESLIYDLDTMLGFPCSLEEYATEAFNFNMKLKPQFERLLRVVPATEFLKTFASDRTHMLTEDGEWTSPPPDYPPISSSSSTNNLQSFISMTKSSEQFGAVQTLEEFINKYMLKG
uniref:protein N-terminal glutamine amidohydrolase-like n=1 Tax=Styela clava TaxID=7725 RepID=UPI0019398A1A|nr:protein N-terminal glutamine amidohydrolase-like [Styela clava]